ncbi:MAG: ATP-binding protein [Syntrophobacteraceae bacterium]
MKLKFGHKLFLTFLANSLAIVICLLFLARYFAHRDFEEYIVKVEIERLDQLASALGQEYKKSNNWDGIVKNWGYWLQVISMRLGRPPGSFNPANPPFPPPPGPPSFAAGGLPPGPPPGPHEIAQRISLFDSEKRPLVGPEHATADGYRLRPVLVGQGTVGWLGFRMPERLTHPLDLEFIRRQSQTFYSIGGVALLLAILVTMLLSRRLLAPLQKLAEGTRALTQRKFDTRISVQTGDEFGQLAADFNAMAQALENYEQMRRQWMADISHELRTPLAILRGEIEAMQDGVREVSPEALASLHFEVLHVARIVQDLHDLSLIESEASLWEKTAVDPLEILEETLGSFATRFEQCGLRIDERQPRVRPGMIMADAARLKQLFSNVLENTLRYAAPGVLKIRHEIAKDFISLHLEDSGPGVPAESLSRLFDRLYRADRARGRSDGGSGLGLAICKGIVERFGGRIEASNVRPSGLRISISFPAVCDQGARE